MVQATGRGRTDVFAGLNVLAVTASVLKLFFERTVAAGGDFFSPSWGRAGWVRLVVKLLCSPVSRRDPISAAAKRWSLC